MRYIGTLVKGRQIETEFMDSGRCVVVKDTSEKGSRYYIRSFDVYFDEKASLAMKMVLKAKKFFPALGGLYDLATLPSCRVTICYDERGKVPSCRIDIKASDTPQLFASFPKVSGVLQSMSFCPTNHNGVHGVVKA